ncbi:hypothetical protein DXA36_17825 [Eisenbergiella sp. OF01-20]|nr:hypothetical protein DXA36_17825 [Eisenbergiella sp. OF01-20]
MTRYPYPFSRSPPPAKENKRGHVLSAAVSYRMKPVGSSCFFEQKTARGAWMLPPPDWGTHSVGNDNKTFL